MYISTQPNVSLQSRTALVVSVFDVATLVRNASRTCISDWDSLVDAFTSVPAQNQFPVARNIRSRRPNTNNSLTLPYGNDYVRSFVNFPQSSRESSIVWSE